jgi:predicted nucleic acid-binding protein
VIVSDSSPLISLARIGRLELLHRLYGDLLIPQAVWHEVVVKGAGQPGVEEIKSAVWIKTATVENDELVLALQRDLGAGEAEAIALALEKKADLLLMDERLGRDTARYFGVRCIGLLGVLAEAKHRREIEAVRPVIDLLVNRAGYRISIELYQRILHDTGEGE